MFELKLVPIEKMGRKGKPTRKPRAYSIRPVSGVQNSYGMVRLGTPPASYILQPYHTHTPLPGLRRNGTKVFQTKADLLSFLADNPQQYWNVQ